MNKADRMKLEEAISICNAIKRNIKCESTFDLNILKLNRNNELAIETVLNYIDNSISKEVIENKIEKLDKEEKEAQDSISDEEREEYSDSSIGYLLANIETRRQVLQELLEGK